MYRVWILCRVSSVVLFLTGGSVLYCIIKPQKNQLILKTITKSQSKDVEMSRGDVATLIFL